MRALGDTWLPWINPADTAQYFQSIVMNLFPIGDTAAHLVVPPNPNRVALTIDTVAALAVSIFPDIPGADAADAAAIAAGGGLFFGNSFDWAGNGPITQVGWKVRCTGADTAIWFETQLTSWPNGDLEIPQAIKVPKCPTIPIVP